MLRKEELNPVLMEIVRTVKAEMPDLIRNRLTHSRHVGNHGSYADFLLVDMWDRNQTDVLPRKHFKYCLSYWEDRGHGWPNGELHLWLNKVRMYQNARDIHRLLQSHLPEAAPAGFAFHEDARAFSISHRFAFPDDLAELPGRIIPLYKELVLQVHPILMQVVDEFTGPMEKETLRQIIAERDRVSVPASRRGTPDLAAYSRSIPPKLRERLLARADFSCALCGADLRLTGHHIDHIQPFARGGLTEETNLQALCPECNLRKGAAG